MPKETEENYKLLRESDVIESEETLQGHDYIDKAKARKSSPRTGCVVSALVVSAITNLLLASYVVLFGFKTNIQDQQISKSSDSGVSLYAQLSPDPSFPFPYSTGYGPLEATNHTYADELWESISIDAGVVAIDKAWAAEHNLAPAQPFPWDDSKGIYAINAFHTLHCLKNLHRIVYHAHHGWPLSRPVPHALHCLDHIRKDALCAADDFLLATPPSRYGNPGPRGQARVCRNWDELVEWAEKNSACYRHITDDEEGFAKDHIELERYTNCPEGSSYFERAREWRDRNGKSKVETN